MTAEYIERELALKILGGYGTSNGSAIGHHSGAVDCAIAEIERLPAADVAEVRQGRWIDRPTVKGQAYCSECATIEKVTDSNYKSQCCPNCGARMDGGADNG